MRRYKIKAAAMVAGAILAGLTAGIQPAAAGKGNGGGGHGGGGASHSVGGSSNGRSYSAGIQQSMKLSSAPQSFQTFSKTSTASGQFQRSSQGTTSFKKFTPSTTLNKSSSGQFQTFGTQGSSNSMTKSLKKVTIDPKVGIGTTNVTRNPAGHHFEKYGSTGGISNTVLKNKKLQIDPSKLGGIAGSTAGTILNPHGPLIDPGKGNGLPTIDPGKGNGTGPGTGSGNGTGPGTGSGNGTGGGKQHDHHHDKHFDKFCFPHGYPWYTGNFGHWPHGSYCDYPWFYNYNFGFSTLPYVYPQPTNSTIFINTPQATPAVPAVTVSGVDLELVDVRLIDGGQPAEQIGPRYRVTFRNAGTTPVRSEFSVTLLAANEAKASPELPQATVRVGAIDSSKPSFVDVRLPVETLSMGRDAGGNKIPFTHLLVIVDSKQEVEEANRDNNVAGLERTQVRPVE